MLAFLRDLHHYRDERRRRRAASRLGHGLQKRLARPVGSSVAR